MSLSVRVVIGSADGAWAEPQEVPFELGEDFTITNTSPVSWPILGAGVISRLAVQVRGEWREIPLTSKGVEVKLNCKASFEPGAIRIVVDPPPAVAVPQDWERRWLTHPRRTLGPGRRQIESGLP